MANALIDNNLCGLFFFSILILKWKYLVVAYIMMS